MQQAVNTRNAGIPPACPSRADKRGRRLAIPLPELPQRPFGYVGPPVCTALDSCKAMGMNLANFRRPPARSEAWCGLGLRRRHVVWISWRKWFSMEALGAGRMPALRAGGTMSAKLVSVGDCVVLPVKPGNIVMLDNLSAHADGEVEKLVAAAPGETAIPTSL